MIIVKAVGQEETYQFNRHDFVLMPGMWNGYQWSFARRVTGAINEGCWIMVNEGDGGLDPLLIQVELVTELRYTAPTI